MRYATVSLVGLLFAGGCGSNPPPATIAETPPQSTVVGSTPTTPPPTTISSKPIDTRNFIFHYKFRVKDLKPIGDAARDVVRVWIPIPTASEHQSVDRLAETVPVALETTKEARYGNQLGYLQLPIPAEGEFRVDLPYEIVRREVKSNPTGSDSAPAVELSETERAQLLAANELVPTTGEPLELLKDVKLQEEPTAKARQLYDLVDEKVVYKKEGTGWGRGDSKWVCKSGYGNCTDFHSLFLSLARAQDLPARFEIGFSIPTDKTEGPIAGYHCWAWFHTRKQGWIPVDISEADKHPEMKEYYFGNLTADRVTFSTGRDLELQPPPAKGPLNFLIFPYIEVGGEPLPKENVELQFSFSDQ